MIIPRRAFIATWSLALLLSAANSPAENHGGEFRSQEIASDIYMLQGTGGNIGVVQGERGLLVIDDDYEAFSDELLAALQDINSRGVRLLLNTHWHGDHAGGNRALGAAGATIIAHENVRLRLQQGGEIKAFGMKVAPADVEALPVVTYADAIGVHWGGMELQLQYAASAHTDGDTVIYFYQGERLLAVHTGDLFFNGFYPFIDVDSGGSARGMIRGVAEILQRINKDTVVIPGHGPLASRVDLQEYHDFLQAAVEQIATLKASGRSRQQTIAARPIEEFEERWGDGFLKTDVWVGIVYDSL